MNRRQFIIDTLAAIASASLYNPTDCIAGDVIDIPGIGNVNLKDKVIPNGHFDWGEVTKSGTRIPRDPKIVTNILATAKYMEEIRTYFGNKPIDITSWYRTPEVNNRVSWTGKTGYHTEGIAVDFTVRGLSSVVVAEKMNKFWGSRGGFGKYPEKGFTHIDSRGHKVRWRNHNEPW